MGALLRCKNVSLGYEGDIITKDLDFTVSSGDYLCIVGENGSGKSTLIKAILGLKPPLEGKVELCEDVGKNEIGYLPQQTMVQRDFPASVREIVLSGCMNRCGLRPFYNKDEKKLAHDMMRRLEIEPLTKRCYRELSGGQQQRVLLARALCAARKMIRDVRAYRQPQQKGRYHSHNGIPRYERCRKICDAYTPHRQKAALLRHQRGLHDQ